MLEFIFQKKLWKITAKTTLTLLHPASFDHFHGKTAGSHVALRKRNSGSENTRELFKGSKDLTSLVVYNDKKNVMVGCRGFFVSDIVSGGFLVHLGPLHLALG